jgi:hypothetical protein
VDDAGESNLQDVTTYAPVRIALRGILRAIFGLMIGGAFVLLLYLAVTGKLNESNDPNEGTPWWLYLITLVILLASVAILSGGAGRFVSAFARGCYFRAGPEGLAVRLPIQGWFGRFRVTEYRFRWEQIKQLVHFTYRINGIPSGTELRIELVSGGRLCIERKYFSASVGSIQYQLLAIRKAAGK